MGTQNICITFALCNVGPTRSSNIVQMLYKCFVFIGIGPTSKKGCVYLDMMSLE